MAGKKDTGEAVKGLLPAAPWVPPKLPMRIMVTGDRDWGDVALVDKVLRTIGKQNISILAHGACRGLDTIAAAVATGLGIKVRGFPAEWTKYGNGAGHIRNREMFKQVLPDLTIAFHDNLDLSKGTADAVGVATRAGCPIVVIGHDRYELRWRGGSKTNTTQDVEGFLTIQVLPMGVV